MTGAPACTTTAAGCWLLKRPKPFSLTSFALAFAILLLFWKRD